jgi:hypothetical protein
MANSLMLQRHGVEGNSSLLAISGHACLTSRWQDGMKKEEDGYD